MAIVLWRLIVPRVTRGCMERDESGYSGHRMPADIERGKLLKPVLWQYSRDALLVLRRLLFARIGDGDFV